MAIFRKNISPQTVFDQKFQTPERKTLARLYSILAKKANKVKKNLFLNKIKSARRDNAISSQTL
jgi:hypothetical protein